jgi:hypothetical protein
MIATTRAAQQAAELHRAELDSARGLEETSIAGVLVWALTPQGGGSVLAGLLDLIERQLFAANTAEAGGEDTSPWTGAAHRLTHAAIEIDRHQRAGRDAAEQAERDEEAEEAEEEAEEAEEAGGAK